MKQILPFLFIICYANNLPAQNVGIGTSTPTDKLHVAGNIKADTIKPNGIKLTPNAGNGKILISDAAGVGTWQASSNLAAAGNIGFGVWGDCATNGNISEYQPVADATGGSSNNFGKSVSISGNYAIVGAYVEDVGSNINQGSASIYQWNGSLWVLMQKITDATGAASDFFGTSVSISGNYAIVGAEHDDVGSNSNQGSASIYQWNGSSWVLMQKITDATGAANDNFGTSVSISGNYAIVGAELDDVGSNTNQGSASIYQWNGSSWVLMDKITDSAGEAEDLFGTSVSISGSYVIVGASGDDVGTNTDQGSAIAYFRFGSNWISSGKMTDINAAAGDGFGNAVSISGIYAIIGAYLDGVGSNSSQGSASIYKRNGTSWDFTQKITEPAGAPGDGFGRSVSISEDYIIVGINSTAFGNSTGRAAIFLRIGYSWQFLQRVTDPGSLGDEDFGSTVAIEGNTKRFLCGANLHASSSGKVLFGKIN